MPSWVQVGLWEAGEGANLVLASPQKLWLDRIATGSDFLGAGGESDRNTLYYPANDYKLIKRRDTLKYVFQNICFLWRLAPVC